MAEILTHTFVSAKADSPDTSLVSASEWNDGHRFTGGVNGQVLIFDNTQPKGIRWTDGSRTYGASYTLPSSPLAGPITGVASITFTTNTTNLVEVTFVIRPVSTTGNVTFTLQVVTDGAGGTAYGFASGTILSIPYLMTLAAGTHTMSITLTSAATFTAAYVDLLLNMHGV